MNFHYKYEDTLNNDTLKNQNDMNMNINNKNNYDNDNDIYENIGTNIQNSNYLKNNKIPNINIDLSKNLNDIQRQN